MKSRILMGILSLAFMGSVAHAADATFSLKEKQMHKAEEEQLAEKVKWANDVCGSKATGSFTWASFKGTVPEGYSVSGYCEAPLEAMRHVCEASPEGKAAVQKSVKKVVCANGGNGKRSVALKDGTLTWKVDFTSANNPDFVKEFLDNNL